MAAFLIKYTVPGIPVPGIPSLKNLEFHLLDTGHFALEEDGDTIADLMRDFLLKKVKR